MEEREQRCQSCVYDTMCVCYSNLTFLILLLISMGLSSYEICCQDGAHVLQYYLIMCAVMFNCTVLLDPYRKLEYIPTFVSETLKYHAERAKERILEFLPVTKPCVKKEEVNIEEHVENLCSSSKETSHVNRDSEDVVPTNSLQSPDMNLVQRTSEIPHDKALSDPVKKAPSYFSKKTENVVLKDKQVKSPELFKNKIYQSRKILMKYEDN